MSDEPILRAKARAAMHSGRLPSCSPERTWGGSGSGDCCAVCGQPFKRDELEYELQFPPDDVGHEMRNCHLHMACFDAWECERQMLTSNLPVNSTPG